MIEWFDEYKRENKTFFFAREKSLFTYLCWEKLKATKLSAFSDWVITEFFAYGLFCRERSLPSYFAKLFCLFMRNIICSVVNCGGLAGKWRFGTFMWRENFLGAGRKKARFSHFQWTSEIFASCSLWFAVFFKKFKFSNSKFLKLWQFGLKLWRYFSKNFGAGFGGFWIQKWRFLIWNSWQHCMSTKQQRYKEFISS